MNYILAIDNGDDGWSLTHYSTLQEIEEEIKRGSTYGSKFKILKELNFKIIDNEAD